MRFCCSSRVVVGLLSAAFALPSAVLAADASPAQRSADTIKIGSITILTGPTSPIGIETARGAAFQVALINKQGGLLKQKVQLVSADDANNPALAAQAAQRLIQDDRVVGIVGPTNSVSALAIQKIVLEAKVPNILYTASAQEVTAAKNPFVFRTVNSLEASYNALVTYFSKTNRYKRFAFIGWNLAAGASSLAGTQIGIKHNPGTELVYQTRLPLTTQDFSGAIGQAKAENPDVVLIGAPMPFAGVVVKQIRLAGWNVPLGHFGGFVGMEFGQFLGRDADGIVMSNNAHWQASAKRKVGKAFVDAFMKANRRPPTENELVGADSVATMAAAIKKAGSTDGPKIAEAMLGLNYNGIRYFGQWKPGGNLKHAPIPITRWVRNGTALTLLVTDVFPIVRK